jgi:spermidine synthase
VEWNRTLIGAPAGHPLADARSRVYVGDVADLIRRERRGFDAILMDGLDSRRIEWLRDVVSV